MVSNRQTKHEKIFMYAYIYILSACHMYRNIFTPYHIYTNTLANHFTAIYIYKRSNIPGRAGCRSSSSQFSGPAVGPARSGPIYYFIYIYYFFITSNMLFFASIPIYRAYCSRPCQCTALTSDPNLIKCRMATSKI